MAQYSSNERVNHNGALNGYSSEPDDDQDVPHAENSQQNSQSRTSGRFRSREGGGEKVVNGSGHLTSRETSKSSFEEEQHKYSVNNRRGPLLQR